MATPTCSKPTTPRPISSTATRGTARSAKSAWRPARPTTKQASPKGGMGTDIADADGDGHLEILVTNFQWESNTLYQGKGDGLWRDRSTAFGGWGPPSFARLAFGANFCDFDRDGDPDLYVANGHIDDNIANFDPQTSYGQRDQLFLNDGQGRFAEISAQAGPFFQRAMVGRGAATADYDNDGDPDLFVVNSNQPAVLPAQRYGIEKPLSRPALGRHPQQPGWLGIPSYRKGGGPPTNAANPQQFRLSIAERPPSFLRARRLWQGRPDRYRLALGHPPATKRRGGRPATEDLRADRAGRRPHRSRG